MDATQRAFYRRLLRALAPAVKFYKPAAANLHRALRDDFVAAVRREGDMKVRLRNTLAFLLSSAVSPRQHALDTSHMASVKIRALAQLRGAPSSSSPSAATPTPRSGDLMPSEAARKAALAAEPTLHHTLAHEATKNLASLIYHHLSPHTQMQPLARRAGGTGAVALLSARESRAAAVQSARREKRLGSEASLSVDDIVAGVLGSGGGGGAGAGAGRDDGRAPQGSPASPFAGEFRIPSLMLPPKPVRGPVGHRAQRWDGQNPSAVFMLRQQAAASSSSITTEEEGEGNAQGTSPSSPSSQKLLALEKRVQEAADAYYASKADTDTTTTTDPHAAARTAHLLHALCQTRGLLKAARHAAELARRKADLQALPQRWLVDLVRNAEESERVWLGGRRFGRWARGEWLAP